MPAPAAEVIEPGDRVAYNRNVIVRKASSRLRSMPAPVSFAEVPSARARLCDHRTVGLAVRELTHEARPSISGRPSQPPPRRARGPHERAGTGEVTLVAEALKLKGETVDRWNSRPAPGPEPPQAADRSDGHRRARPDGQDREVYVAGRDREPVRT